jgi:pimeloyl-ACP methyl ester carboxylesterase
MCSAALDPTAGVVAMMPGVSPVSRSALTRRCALLAPAALLPTLAAAADRKVRLETRVPVDDAQLYLLVRGDDPDAPLLLWLHGGPGGAERPLFRLYNGALEHRFVVAYWDQRGAGLSYDPDADPGRLTIAQHLADLDAIVDYLLETFGREKVVLLGHSWGTALGLLYARDHPEKVAAFVGAGVESSAPAFLQARYDTVAAEARRRGDDDVLRKLDEIGPAPWEWKEELAIEDLLGRYGGDFHDRPSFVWATVRVVLGGMASPFEIARIIHGNNASLEAMNHALRELDLTREVPALQVPVAFLLGRYDRVTDSRLAAAYFEQLQAPAKRLVWFKHSAHNIPFEEPEAFNAAVPRVLGELGATAG